MDKKSKKSGFVNGNIVALKKSFTNINKNIIMSMSSDFLIVILWFVLGYVFNQFVTLAYSDVDNALFNLLNESLFRYQIYNLLFYLGLALFSVLLFILMSSFLLALSWSTLLKRKFRFSNGFILFKQNLIYLLAGFIIFYGIYFIFVDPIWQLLALLFIIIFLGLIPILHIRIITKKEAKKIKNILTSFIIFKNNFHYFLVAAIIAFIVGNIITLPVLINPHSQGFISVILYLILGLLAISWTKLYFIQIMRLIE